MFHVSTIKNRFKMRVSDFNKIVEFLNNLCGGLGINIKRPDSPSASSPPMIEIDRNDLIDLLKELVAPQEPQNPTELSSGYSSSRASDTDTFTASMAPNAKGAKIYLLTATIANGTDVTICPRPFTIAPDGRIYSIGAEDDAQAIDVVQSSTS